MKDINIFYLHDGFQFSAEDIQRHRHNGWLGREPLPLDVLTQIGKDQFFNPFGELFNISVVNSKEQCDDKALTLVPIDIQSFPLSIENRKYYEMTEFGKEVDNVIKHIINLSLPNTVFLIYSSTEPYFYDANIYLAELGLEYPNIKFIISGSGETVDYFGHYNRVLKKVKNVIKIHKLWYFDRVHYMTFISDNEEFNNVHIDLKTKKTTDEKQDIDVVPNRFLCTLRNCRSHRLLFSTLLENSKHGLDDITYSRFYSLRPGDLSKIISSNNKRDKEDFPYHIQLIAKSLMDLTYREKIDDSLTAKIFKNILSAPHKIDMESLEDRGIPGEWLYEDCDIVIAPGGEPYGYGYVDEKQFIPMVFKKPYLTFGCKGLYEELKKIDFKVFDDCWPTNYNSFDTLLERVKGFFSVFEYLRCLEGSEFTDLMEKANESVEFNYQHLTSGNFRRLSNEIFFKEINDACS